MAEDVGEKVRAAGVPEEHVVVGKFSGLLAGRFAEPGRDDALACGVARLVARHRRQEVVAAEHEQRRSR